MEQSSSTAPHYNTSPLHPTIAVMWAPSNAYALPSKEEIEDTKEAIITLETRLRVAAGASWRSTRKVRDLQQEIEQRKAWIAPIRRIPHDVLSLIFLQTCQAHWQAPFILGGVCTIWRRSLLDTPLAWRFVQLQHLKTTDAIWAVLDRSLPYPIYLDASKGGICLSVALEGRTERLECLKVDVSSFELLQNPFSNLTKLAVFGPLKTRVAGDLWDLLDGVKLPRLRCLFTSNLLDSLDGTLPPHVLPPIEELSLSTRNPRFIAGIIGKLAHKLTSLYVFLIQMHLGHDNQPIEILFPRLQDLAVIYSLTWNDTDLWPFNARTPALVSYKQNPAIPGRNLHRDTETVTHLAFSHKIDFRLFPRLREVTSNPEGIHTLMQCLEEDSHLWPDIETVHCQYRSDVEERVNAFNHRDKRNIRCNLTGPALAFLVGPWSSWAEFSRNENS